MASVITVTATVQDPSSASLAGNCYVRFRLRNFAGYVPQVSGTSIMPEIQVDALPTAGAISQNLWPNNAITPSTTFYTVELWNNGRITSSGNYIFNANTSLNSASQVNTPPVPAGFLLVLENNGALNSSQSTLNLESTDASVTITDLGSGNINLQGSKGSSFSTSNNGWFAGPGMTDISSILMNSATTHLINYSANTVVVFQFVLQSSWTLSKVAYQLSASGAGGSAISFGIYSAAGNKLIDSGALNGASTSVQTASFGPTTLAPGTYYFAVTSTDSNAHGPCAQVGSIPIQIFAAVNATAPLFATAANAATSGVLPNTLGVLSSASGATVDSMPLPIWKV
jgi:hypothetical protein